MLRKNSNALQACCCALDTTGILVSSCSGAHSVYISLIALLCLHVPAFNRTLRTLEHELDGAKYHMLGMAEVSCLEPLQLCLRGVREQGLWLRLLCGCAADWTRERTLLCADAGSLFDGCSCRTAPDTIMAPSLWSPHKAIEDLYHLCWHQCNPLVIWKPS